MKRGQGPLRTNPAAAGFFHGVRRCLPWAALSCALLLGGCATPQLSRLEQAWPAGLPERALLADTPFFAQQDYECGPAALASLLQAAGLGVTPAQLQPQVYLPGRRGSLQLELLVAARRQGLPAYVLEPGLPTLLAEVAAGHPVLVFQNLSLAIYPVWHYAVLIGYDRQRGTVQLHSGRTAALEMPLATFERTWARGDHWAMVALAPGRLPASAEAQRMAAAIAALERLRPDQARIAYAGALRRWPEQPVLLLGAGNSAYASGDLPAAAAAYRHAVQILPQLAEAWNNLAQVLMEQGQLRPAREAVKRALALGGPQRARYQELDRQLDAAGAAPAARKPRPGPP